MTFASIAVLLAISIVCIVGSFAPQFHDNTLQRIGMTAIGFSSSVQSIRVYESNEPSVTELTIYIGILVFAAGTFINNHHFVRACKKHSSSIWESRF